MKIHFCIDRHLFQSAMLRHAIMQVRRGQMGPMGPVNGLEVTFTVGHELIMEEAMDLCIVNISAFSSVYCAVM